MSGLPGSDLFRDRSMNTLERWYCRLFGVPIVGLRIRLRGLLRHLPNSAASILDAGCGRGVISRTLARRYPDARVDAIDQDASGQEANNRLATELGLNNCRFLTMDLGDLDADGSYDLIVSIDNLEHIEDDRAVLARIYRAMQPGGHLIVHVPHYYRRWPVLKWHVNFDVPGHVRPGYHLAEIMERIRGAGFTVDLAEFSYGFLENLANNISYRITAAEQRNRVVYALAFPVLNFLAWLGRTARPEMGAGVWVLATRPAQATAPAAEVSEDDPE